MTPKEFDLEVGRALAADKKSRGVALMNLCQTLESTLLCLRHPNVQLRALVLDKLSQACPFKEVLAEIECFLEDPRLCSHAARVFANCLEFEPLYAALFDKDTHQLRGPIVNAILSDETGIALGNGSRGEANGSRYYGRLCLLAFQSGVKAAEAIWEGLQQAIEDQDTGAIRTLSGLLGRYGTDEQIAQLEDTGHVCIEWVRAARYRPGDRFRLDPNVSVVREYVENFPLSDGACEEPPEVELKVRVNRQRQVVSIDKDEESDLSSTSLSAKPRGRLVGGCVLGLKAKQFDDGLMCALQMEFGGLEGLLRRWHELVRLSTDDGAVDARARLVAALRLVGESPDETAEIEEIAERMVKDVRKTCPPLSFYCWHPVWRKFSNRLGFCSGLF